MMEAELSSHSGAGSVAHFNCQLLSGKLVSEVIRGTLILDKQQVLEHLLLSQDRHLSQPKTAVSSFGADLLEKHFWCVILNSLVCHILVITL